MVYAIAPHIDALVAREKPDAILHLGLAGSRRRVSVETRAKNAASNARMDASGRRAAGLALDPRGPAAMRSTWNAQRLTNALRAARLDAALSNDAGDYVCNALLWRSLEAGAAPAIFIHIPRRRRIAPAKIAAALARVLPAFANGLARESFARRRFARERS